MLGFSFFFSSRRRHTRCLSDWSSDVCSSDLLRLDLMVALDVDERTGLPGRVRGAHLLPVTPEQVDDAEAADAAYTFFEAPAASQLDVDFLELINSLEEEMARNRRAVRRAAARDRAILVGVTTAP